MATRDELLQQAKDKGLDVTSRTKKSELETLLSQDQVRVNENQDGEATNGTTQEGSEEPVTNETSIPQNGQTEVDTLNVTDNEIAKDADEARTEEDVKFSDESNPNQKARDAGAPDEEFDQDGNRRTGGYSYGVAPDDTEGTVPNQENKGTAPEDLGDRTDMLDTRAEQVGSYLNPGVSSDVDTNNSEWSFEDQKALEESLSQPEKGIKARVLISTGRRASVDFFYNNKPLGSYKSRDFKEEDARKELDRLIEERGL